MKLNQSQPEVHAELADTSLSAIYRQLFGQFLARIDPDVPFEGTFSANKHSESSAQPRVNQAELARLLAQIEESCGHAGFGLKVGEEIHPSDYSTLGYLLMNCESLKHALEFATRYKFVLNPNFNSTLTLQEEQYHYQLLPHKAGQTFFPTLVELDFASAVQLARFLVGKNNSRKVKLKCVSFQHPPQAPLHEYQTLFRCPLHFEASSNLIVLDKQVVDLPIRAANQQFFNMLKRKLKRIETSGHLAPRFSQQIFKFLANQQGYVPDLCTTAQHFNVSTSTLKKRLQQESLSFSAICDELNKKNALKLMRRSDTLIKEIYTSLNFKSASAFNRAFKRWTGLSPSQYRATMKEPKSM